MSNYIVAGIVIVLAVVLFVLLRSKYANQVYQMLAYLVAKAEQEFGSGTGELKYSAVSAWVYERLPAMAKLILSQNLIDELIEEAVDWLQSWLEENERAKELIEG